MLEFNLFSFQTPLSELCKQRKQVRRGVKGCLNFESWITPIIKPTATTCMEMSSEIPKREQAIGIRRRDPPATPEAPHAERAARRLRMMAVGISTWIPRVKAVAIVITVMVIAAPSMLMVAPRGMVTE